MGLARVRRAGASAGKPSKARIHPPPPTAPRQIKGLAVFLFPFRAFPLQSIQDQIYHSTCLYLKQRNHAITFLNIVGLK